MGKIASVLLSLPLVFVLAKVSPALSQSGPPPTKTSVLDEHRERTNANVTTIVSGNPNGGFLRIAYDIAATVDDGDDMRVLPIVGKGSVQNIRDILFLRGVDMGLAQAHALNEAKRSSDLGRHVVRQIVYITRLFEDEAHMLVRPEINDLKDLDGKPVNFSDAGSGSELAAELLFKGFGIRPKKVNMGQADAMEKMKKGEVFGTFCACLKPLTFHRALAKDVGFKLLPIPLEGPLQESFVPAAFTHEDYPNLVPEGTTIETIAVPTALIAYNWPHNHDRYRRLANFTEAFFNKFLAKKFNNRPRHPRWKNVNLAAELKGWTRLKAAQDWLDNVPSGSRGPATASGVDAVLARVQAARAAPGSAAEQERLFQEFLAWAKRRQEQKR